MAACSSPEPVGLAQPEECGVHQDFPAFRERKSIPLAFHFLWSSNGRTVGQTIREEVAAAGPRLGNEREAEPVDRTMLGEASSQEQVQGHIGTGN